jgi:para-nitrobenzyl esterase
VRDATSFGSHCLQPAAFGDDGSVTSTEGSEDCLFLNVFAPAGTSASSHLPVIVHLHGGGNAFGWGEEDASAFVAHGVIVVTLNYRLGGLGFVGHPALTVESGSSGEYGVLDQIAALHWVHDNIASFGGDPGNVTLAGFSAGSFDTVALMASPLTSGLIRRAAVQGESYWALTGMSSMISDSEALGSELAGRTPCATSSDVVGCLRALPADLIVREAGVFDVAPWVGGVVLPKSALELVARGHGLPLLVGFDREEDSVFEWPYLADPFTNLNWVHTTNLLVGPQLGAKARALYPSHDYESLKWAYITMATDAKRGCPTRTLANTVAAQAPVYRYLFTHVLDNDPNGGLFKSSHGTEDVLLWGREWYEPTPGEELLTQQMISYWTNFAKTGDPNATGLPVWPQYDTATEPILTLDLSVAPRSAYHVAQCSLLDTGAPFSFLALGHGRKIGLFDFLP